MGEPNDEFLPEPEPLAEDVPLDSPEVSENPAPDVAQILKAYDYTDFYGLVIIQQDMTEQEPYVLYPDDPYGLAPGLRAQLERMVADGEIVIEPPPPVAEPLI